MTDRELTNEMIKRADAFVEKQKREFAIAELEKIREKFREELQGSMKDSLDYTIGIAKGIEIIDRHIEELKGENNAE